MKHFALGLIKAILTVVVLIIAIMIFILLMDADRLKPIIATRIAEVTGHVATMPDPLHLSLFPHIIVQVPTLTLREPKAATPFITLHGITFAPSWRMLLLPRRIFSGTVQVKQIDCLGSHFTNLHSAIQWQHHALQLTAVHADLNGVKEGLANRTITVTNGPDIKTLCHHYASSPST